MDLNKIGLKENNHDVRIVLKVGGSLLFNNKYEIQEDKLKRFAEIIIKAPQVKAVIIGGGKIARLYIKAARLLNSNDSVGDLLGIGVSRLNAMLLIESLKERAYPEPIKDLHELRKASLWDRVVVSGGFIPGQSTTSVTFEIAEMVKASHVLILTNVDGIYDKDPNKFEDAKKFDKITLKEVEEILNKGAGDKQAAAGEYRILDSVSIQIMKRNNFTVRLVNGEDYIGLEEILIKNNFDLNIGTLISRS